MKNRRTVFWILVLAVAAAATQLLVWWLRPPPREHVMVGPPRASYELDQFSLRAFGQDGRLAFTMTAPHLARREGNDALYVNAPRYTFIGNDGSHWHGTSQYAWISSDNSVVKLIGKTDIKRPAAGRIRAARIQTADATVWTQDKRMATEAPSVIREPGSILRGTGMKADFNSHSMELLSHVQGTFDPPPQTAH